MGKQSIRIKLIMLSEKDKLNSELKKLTGLHTWFIFILATIVAIGLILGCWLRFRLTLDMEPVGSKADFPGMRHGPLNCTQTSEDCIETKDAPKAPRKDSPVLTELKKQVEKAEADSKAPEAPKVASKSTQVKRLAKLLEADKTKRSPVNL